MEGGIGEKKSWTIAKKCYRTSNATSGRDRREEIGGENILSLQAIDAGPGGSPDGGGIVKERKWDWRTG